VKVGVLGGAGLIGRALVDGLKSDGVETTVVPRMPIPSGPTDHEGLDRLDAWRSAISAVNFDWLLNAAGAAAPTVTDWPELLKLNVLLPLYLANSFATQSPRILHISSAAVCGRGPINDSRGTLRQCGTPYARSKCLGECAILVRAVKPIVLRLGSVVDDSRNGTARRLLSKLPLIVLSRNSVLNPLMSLSDVVDGCRAVLSEPPTDTSILVCLGGETADQWARRMNERAKIVMIPDVIPRMTFGLAYRLSSRAVPFRATCRAAEVFVRGQDICVTGNSLILGSRVRG
jgi:nucleoside-diphosphate-sugar epimerase